MPAAKVHDLKVRPLQSVDLCFEVDGIVGEQNAKMPMLGLPVTPFDFPTFYAGLGVENNTADPGRLKYNSQAIHDDPSVTASMLYALRSEPPKAVLDKAIAARENSFYQKYKNQAAIIAQMQLIYTAANAASKPARLSALLAISQNQHDALDAAYTADARTGVVKTTTSSLTGTTGNTGTSSTTSNGGVTIPSTTSTQDSKNSSTMNGQTGATGTSSTTNGTGTITTTAPIVTQSSTNTANSTTNGSSTQTQSTANTDYVYRHPSLENNAQYQRAQISLLDEQFAQFMAGQNLPLLDRVFTNELSAIDLDVKRLQVTYLNTILMSPINGIVTGLYKHLGDCVKAGEPVLRVEDNTSVLLVGTLIFRGLLSIGSNVSVTTTIFDSPNSITISGAVVSVRGHDSKDDEWNVLVRCSNVDAAGNQILPINYNFDYDDTSVTIS